MNEREIVNAVLRAPLEDRETVLQKLCQDDQALLERVRQEVKSMTSDRHTIEPTQNSDALAEDSTASQIQSGDGAPSVFETQELTASELSQGSDGNDEWESENNSLDLPSAKSKIDQEVLDPTEVNLSPEQAAGNQTSPTERSESMPRISGFELLKRLGEGGMGEVWLAQQHQPVKRQVALKLIKEGIGSAEVLARFEAERQALALMDHPHIARILDAGATPEGQPFFAMELVHGKPLTTFCDEQHLNIDQRLELFAQVCEGVQHAHQKGIIHRDLKPGNILVTMVDGKPIPKVIDFGLAKAIEAGHKLTEQSLFTGIGKILGTLRYMSPEQANLDAADIDTRTDIYSLGVVLYELLTGTTPLDDSSIKQHAALKVLEFIREKEAVKPSSRLSGFGRKEVSTITNRRKTDSVRLNRVLAGDLDWIVMKALEKDRKRRYESATGFAEDVRRYLGSEPVVARPPSVRYRVQKFVKKNRIGVLAATALLLVLLVSIAATTTAMFRAWDAEALAEARFSEANNARQAETEQRRVADKRRIEAEMNAETARQQSQLALQTLTSVVLDLQDSLKNVPGGSAIRGRLLATSLAKLQEVSSQFIRQSVIDQSTWSALIKIGDLVSRFGEQENNWNGDQSDGELSAPQQSANKLAEDYYLRAFEIAEQESREKPQDSRALHVLSVSHSKLADVLLRQGRTVEALERYEAGLAVAKARVELVPEKREAIREVFVFYDLIGDLLYGLGQVEDAIEQHSQGLQIIEPLALDYPNDTGLMRDLSVSYESIGKAWLQLGQVDRALQHLQACLDITRQLHRREPDNAGKQYDVAVIQLSLSEAKARIGRVSDAIEHGRDGLRFAEQLAQAEPNDLRAQETQIVLHCRLGDLFFRLQRQEETTHHFEAALRLAEKRADAIPDDTNAIADLAIAHDRMGDLQIKLGQPGAARLHYEEGLQIRDGIIAAVGSNPARQRARAVSFLKLGDAYLSLGQPQKAIEYYQQSVKLEKEERALSILHNKLGDVFLQIGEQEKALTQYGAGLEIRKQLGQIDASDKQAKRDIYIAHDKMGNVLLKLGRLTEAREHFQDGLEISQALAAIDQQNVEAQHDLMCSCYKMSQVGLATEDYGMAVQHLQVGIEVLEKMIEKGQRVEAATKERSELENLMSYLKTKRLALGDWDVLMQQPEDQLLALLELRARDFSKRQQLAEAEQAVDRLLELPGVNPGQLYYAACIYSISAEAIGTVEEGADSSDAKRRDDLLKRAFEALEQAIEEGWANFDAMLKDPGLEGLRKSYDLKTLIPSKAP